MQKLSIKFNQKVVVVSLLLLNVISLLLAGENISITNDGQLGLYSVYSAKTLGKTHFVFNLANDFSSDESYLRRVIVFDSARTDTVHPQLALIRVRPNLSYGITNYLDVALTVPFFFDIVESLSPQGGLSDADISFKLRMPRNNKIFNAAFLGALTIPIGKKNVGYFATDLYYLDQNATTDTLVSPVAFHSSRNFDFKTEGLITIDAKWFLFHLNTGCNFTLNTSLDNVLLFGTAIELRPSTSVSIFTEISSENRFYNISHGFKIFDDPVWLSPGIAFTSSAGATMSLVGGINLSTKKEINYYDFNMEKRFTTRLQPSWRIALQLGWGSVIRIQDHDNDLVPDDEDKCPQTPEDIDGYEDQDGCPDPDNDMDGIPDSLDKCISVPEDKDGFQDEDGCPDLDNDKDGIADSLDKCPNIPEDRDGFNDGDGCPDYDNDQDGIPDSLDKCISLPEDIDGFEDTDGCPDLDNDLDGVPDSLDKCPNSAGTKDNNGCPSAKTPPKEIKSGKIILSGVAFEPKSATLVQSAYRILDKLYESLNGYPNVRLIITGHTDATGNSNENILLTKKRAEVVKEYLVGRGISASRLISEGKGDTEPIADNSSIPGQQLNNRIEIRRVD